MKYCESKNCSYTMSKNAILALESMLEDGYNVSVADKGKSIEFKPYERPYSQFVASAPTICIVPQESIRAIERLINTGFAADVKVEKNDLVVVRVARKKVSQVTLDRASNIAH